jgi:hypothetical protein
VPIRPSERARYPPDWPAISLRIRERSGGRCECHGDCGRDHDAESLWAGVDALRALDVEGPPGPLPYVQGRCEAQNGRPHPVTGSKVVLTVAHLNHTPEDCTDDNLLAMCQRCHLKYDAAHHAETRAVRKAAGLSAQMPTLFDLPPEGTP